MKTKTIKIDLPIAYVDLIADCLKVITKHNLYHLLSTDHSEEQITSMKLDILAVKLGFVLPLQELDCDSIIEVNTDD